ncbi:MAG: polymorphic toxin-type HINT domain-containing protein [Pelagimonas sp.]|nr:polymorphic toxin-type HINT domain-containing protein [Pelagimonas sp.]
MTSEHPLFVVGKGWTRAEEVVTGDGLRTVSLGDQVAVLAIEVDRTPRAVHNLEVEGAATYLVGQVGVWVQNAGLGSPFKGKNLRDSPNIQGQRVR